MKTVQDLISNLHLNYLKEKPDLFILNNSVYIYVLFLGDLEYWF